MWLGIDIGTGGTRALLVDERGRVSAAVHRGARRHCAWSARCGPSSVRRTGGTPPQAAIRGALAAGRRLRHARCAASAFPARCTAW